MAEYEILEEYVEALRPDIDAGSAVTVEVRDVDTFERLVVRAILAPSGGDGAGDRLVLRNLAENVSAADWTIRILETLDPEAVEIRPVSAFRRHGGEG